MERHDVDDGVARRHERDVATEGLERRDRVGGALGGSSFALEHEAAHRLVDAGEVPVQELLGVVRLGGDEDAFAELQHRLQHRGAVPSRTCDEPALGSADGRRRAESLRDGVGQPRDVLPAERGERPRRTCSSPCGTSCARAPA